MFIVLDGPEKAGKTTFAQVLVAKAEEQGKTAKYRHWSGDDPVTEAARDEILEDLDEYDVVVWDRSWASGYVYERLGFEQSPDALQFEGEAVMSDAVPMRIMLLGPSHEILQVLRDETDLPVSAYIERAAFMQYAIDFGWQFVINAHAEMWADAMATQLLG